MPKAYLAFPRLPGILLLVFILGISVSPLQAQAMTSLDLSSWETDSLQGTFPWARNLDTSNVSVQVLEGNSHRLGYPANIGTFNYTYQESWFQTWWADAGVTSLSIYTPSGLHVWGSGSDTVLFCFSEEVQGDSNFLFFHQVDFSVTQLTIQAYACGQLIDHTLVELNESSGSPTFTTTATQATFSASAGANRRHLVRFNQNFDSVKVVENNAADLLALGFMGYGNVSPIGCKSCPCLPCTVLPMGNIHLEGSQTEAYVALKWGSFSHDEMDVYEVEKLHNGSLWRSLGQGNLIQTNSNHSGFEFKDFAARSGTNIYRIHKKKFGGPSEFSNVLEVTHHPDRTTKLFPNPVTGNRLRIIMDSAELIRGEAELQVFNFFGIRQVVPYSLENGNIFQAELGELPSGMYLVQIQSASGLVFSQKIQINP